MIWLMASMAAHAFSTTATLSAAAAIEAAVGGGVFVQGQLEQGTDLPVSLAAFGGSSVPGGVWRAGGQLRWVVLGDFGRNVHFAVEGRSESASGLWSGAAVGGKWSGAGGLTVEGQAGVLGQSGFSEVRPLWQLGVGWSF